ncbi:hypothetical protein [Streptomyces sp. NPDC002690]
MRKTLKFGITAVFSAAALAITTPASAWTGSYISSNSGQAYVRGAATTNSAILGIAPNGRLVDMMCWKTGEWANGNYWTDRWFYSTVQSNGTNNWNGYVHASLVANQKSVPRCP